jgi:hypothetical protein
MYSSPLSKDQRPKKIVDSTPKEKFKISVGTTKKILKIKGVNLGLADMKWLNGYIENKVRGECLPISFWSNDILSELGCLGDEGSAKFIMDVKRAFCQQCRPNLLPYALELLALEEEEEDI